MAYNKLSIGKLITKFVLILSLLFTAIAAAETNYDDMLNRERLKIPQCGKSIFVKYPARFSVAGNSEEVERQSQLIEDLHRNPARKARYSHILMIDWSSQIPSPMIAIGVLEIAGTKTAELNDQDWKALKQRLLAMGFESKKGSISQRLVEFEKPQKGRANPNFNRIIGVMETEDNELVILNQTGMRHQQRQLGMISASKLIRVNDCAVFVNMLFFQGDYQLGPKLEELATQVLVSKG